MYQGIDHIAIAAQDSRALIEWYCTHLEMHVVAQNEKDPPTALVAGSTGSMFEIMPAREAPVVEHAPLDPGLRHVALRVDDLEAAHAHLQALGVKILSEVSPAAGGGKLISFQDPEGNMLQIVQRPTDFAGK